MNCVYLIIHLEIKLNIVYNPAVVDPDLVESALFGRIRSAS